MKCSKHPASFVDLVREQAEKTPNREAFTFLTGMVGGDTTWTTRHLDTRARAIAAALQQQHNPGERVLVLERPGLEYVASFLGCLYAGLVAVPAYPPGIGGFARHLPRLRTLARDAAATAALTSSATLGADQERIDRSGLPKLRLVYTDEVPDACSEEWRAVRPAADRIAFLQYTSGSTRTPRGVRVTHANLLANSECIFRAMGLESFDRLVSWLPPYHDMGLIGGILQPLYAGMPAALMSPLTFIQSPYCWLEEISRGGRVVSGCPNLGYQLTVRRIPLDQREGLDLRGWQVAFCGAEPIRAGVLRAFTEAFAPCGFSGRSLFPCFGLAEATLMLTGGHLTSGSSYLRVSKAELARGVAVERAGDEGTKGLVSSGRAVDGHDVRVVDPSTRRTCPEGIIGEVWASGPSIADGYWGDSAATAATFAASLDEAPESRYLRTGDLGFVLRGEFCVTGRIDDVIQRDGRNLYPDDLERTVEACHDGLRIASGAAFSVEADDGDVVVIVQEISQAAYPAVGDSLFEAVREALAREHGITPDAIVFIAPRSLPKTSSGKVRRRACRRDYLADRLQVVARWPAVRPSMQTGAAGGDPHWNRLDELVSYLTRQVRTVLDAADGAVPPASGFVDLGVNSACAVEIRNRVQADLGVPLPVTAIFEYPTINALAAHLATALNGATADHALETNRLRDAPAMSATSLPNC